jgi:serine/threonine protein kinase
MQPRRPSKCPRLETDSDQTTLALSAGPCHSRDGVSSVKSRELLAEFFAQPAYSVACFNNLNAVERLALSPIPGIAVVYMYAALTPLGIVQYLKAISRSSMLLTLVRRLFGNTFFSAQTRRPRTRLLTRLLPDILFDVVHLSKCESDMNENSAPNTGSAINIRTRSSVLLPRQLSEVFTRCTSLIPASILQGDAFVIVSQVGEGDFGRVFEIFDRQQNSFYALKKLKRKVIKPRHYDACLREVRIMQELALSPYVVRYVDSWIDDYLHIQMELCEGSFCKVTGKQFHSEDFMLRVLAHVSSALCAMHRLGAVHLDIKPDNIYLVSDHPSGLPVFKLGDFGTARYAHDTKDMEEGANAYMAPELLKLESLDYSSLHKADVFSLGVMVYEAVRGERMTRECIATLRLTGTVPRFPGNISDELFSLLSRMMLHDPALRPSANDITVLPQIRGMFADSPQLLPSLNVGH